MNGVRLKICGLTREADVGAAVAAGADAIGFVLWPDSPRAVSAARAAALGRLLPPWTARVGVMVAPSPDDAAAAVRDARLTALQLHGVLDVAPYADLGVPLVLVRALDVAEAEPTPPGATLMLDAHDPVRHGGTGRTIDWSRAAAIAAREPIVLAGGLTADNVAEAVTRVRPYGVDVSSGVEDTPGLKSSSRIAAFADALRRASAGIPA
jgi:phosphoribosylanthranilate isomerase